MTSCLAILKHAQSFWTLGITERIWQFGEPLKATKAGGQEDAIALMPLSPFPTLPSRRDVPFGQGRYNGKISWQISHNSIEESTKI